MSEELYNIYMFKKGYKQTQEHKDKIGKANKVLKGKGNVKYWLGKKPVDIIFIHNLTLA